MLEETLDEPAQVEPFEPSASASAPRVIVKNVVLCDTIRREDNGKHILIGVYSGSIAVPEFPVNLALGIWIRFDLPGTDEAKIDCQLLAGETVVGNIDAIPIRPGPSSLALCGIFAQMSEAGNLVLQFRQPGGEWETVESVIVALPATQH